MRDGHIRQRHTASAMTRISSQMSASNPCSEANITQLLQTFGEELFAPEDDDEDYGPNVTLSVASPPSLELLARKAQQEVVRGDSVEEVVDTSLPILVFLSLMFLTYIIGYHLKRNGIMVLHETGAALLLGCVFGAAMQYSANNSFLYMVGGMGEFITVEKALVFDDNFFFLVLLPPIIFDAGFNIVATVLKHRFWHNFDAICLYAFLGTTISMLTVGFVVYESGQLGYSLDLPLLDSMCFGALISATDPVTTLAIFQDLNADLDLYSLVFGESVMNDAISIVLYASVLSFKTIPLTSSSMLMVFGTFWMCLLGSVLIGVGVALAISLLLKHTSLNSPGYEHHEAALVMLSPYLAYLLATCFELSGMVSILFCGVAMARYTVVNLSSDANELVSNFYKLAASVSEMFIFIYMGVAVFSLNLSGAYVSTKYLVDSLELRQEQAELNCPGSPGSEKWQDRTSGKLIKAERRLSTYFRSEEASRAKEESRLSDSV
ncbi:hypothetical protein CYMTET_53054 [Cymbomonas tetramitiformis]|uniref:Cation/H+ exchanger transmembrane domain-containing protein n=1 Tax=Cymbomonas tetramitiformis TaxID=36881 RepID=A0AAE0EQR0_9CHLO|nr:hypothetical protein CYMTET_53054 [Cymbomonas tetramitiformis]